MKLLFLILFIWQYASAQKVSVVLDKETKNPIPYATIKVLNTKFGAIATEKGSFHLYLNKNDTLLISSVGYNSRCISNNDFDSIIYLESTSQALNSVYVKTKRFIRNVTVGKIEKANDPDVTWGPTFKLSEEFGKEIALPDSSLIYKINKVFIPVQKNGKCFSPLFLHIYVMDSLSNVPGEEVFMQPFEISRVNLKKDLVIIDLSKENILIENEKKIVVSFSWIPHKLNHYCFSTLPFLYKDSLELNYSRFLDDVDFKWRRFGSIQIEGKQANISLNLAVELVELKY